MSSPKKNRGTYHTLDDILSFPSSSTTSAKAASPPVPTAATSPDDNGAAKLPSSSATQQDDKKGLLPQKAQEQLHKALADVPEQPPACADLPIPASISRGHRSEAARSYGTLPFQFKRLFYSPNAADCRFGNRNLKLVHRDPHVYEVADFLSETEYEHLEQLIEQQFGKFSNSYTDEDVDAQVVNGSRTSAFISLRKGGGSKVRSIENRASEIVGLAPENVEPLQLVGYRHMESFDVHHDMGTLNTETGEVEAVSPRRLITFFVYLNTLPRGQGHTVFPLLDGGRFSVQPKRLKALLWCNVLENGAPDPRLIHRADPVREEGHLKFGINIWITDKNLGALSFSTSGAILDPNKIIPGKRTILVMIDPPCTVCKSRDRQQFLSACDHCDVSYHRQCLLPEARPPPPNGPRKFWTCPMCPGKRPRPGDFCEVCGGGDREHLIVLCDTCERGFHTTCLGMRKVPKESYYCEPCQVKQEAKERADKAREEGACQACGGMEEPHRILLCDGCDGEWHLACVGLKRVPRKEFWFCRACAKGGKKTQKEEGGKKK